MRSSRRRSLHHRQEPIRLYSLTPFDQLQWSYQGTEGRVHRTCRIKQGFPTAASLTSSKMLAESYGQVVSAPVFMHLRTAFC